MVPIAPQASSLFEVVDRIANDTLEKIRADIGDCTRCRLCEQRTNIVFGDGTAKAELVFVGEGPGRDEDIQGLPFVGRSGKLLTQMIEAMGLSRQQVYICNVVKCRPPDNRTPEKDEVATCSPFLLRQLDVIKPKVIVCLGNCASASPAGHKSFSFQLSRPVARFSWYQINGHLSPSLLVAKSPRQSRRLGRPKKSNRRTGLAHAQISAEKIKFLIRIVGAGLAAPSFAVALVALRPEPFLFCPTGSLLLLRLLCRCVCLPFPSDGL